MTYGSGSTGYTSAARVKAVIDEFFTRPEAHQTSAVFAGIWSSRVAAHRDVPLPYIIGGGEANSAAGWWAYIRRLHGSTRNTSTKSLTGQLGLPGDVWNTFVVDLAIMNALSTLVFMDGTTDSDVGVRVQQFLMSDAIDSDKYRRGGYREILEAWSVVGSTAAGSSA